MAPAEEGNDAQQPTLDALLHDALPGPATAGGADWTAAAVGFLGVVDAFLEPDPDV